MSGGSTRSGRLVVNREIPDDVPVKPQGSMLVIVRVVWTDGLEEWRPARAVRWTATHVMVAWKDDESDPRSERHEWLRAGDVARSVSWFVPPGRSNERPAASSQQPSAPGVTMAGPGDPG